MKIGGIYQSIFDDIIYIIVDMNKEFVFYYYLTIFVSNVSNSFINLTIENNNNGQFAFDKIDLLKDNFDGYLGNLSNVNLKQLQTNFKNTDIYNYLY